MALGQILMDTQPRGAPGAGAGCAHAAGTPGGSAEAATVPAEFSPFCSSRRLCWLSSVTKRTACFLPSSSPDSSDSILLSTAQDTEGQQSVFSQQRGTGEEQQADKITRIHINDYAVSKNPKLTKWKV